MSKNRRGAKGNKQDEREQEDREKRTVFLIVCEGKKTEPFYFEAFPVPQDTCDVVGKGANTVSLVDRTITEREDRETKRGTKYDQVWVVMDKDSFSVKDFNEALRLAKANGIKVAYTNEAFELWYLLHFDFHQSGIPRDRYKALLTKKLGFKYEKNNPDMYILLEDKQLTAIRYAEKLLKWHKEGGRTLDPARDNPCTTVHKLVQQLREHSRR